MKSEQKTGLTLLGSALTPLILTAYVPVGIALSLCALSYVMIGTALYVRTGGIFDPAAVLLWFPILIGWKAK